MMNSVDFFISLMALLQLLKRRREDLPDEEADLGRAILQLIDELSVSFINSSVSLI
jgi:hypothetical protein